MFDDSLLEDPDALAAVDAELRYLASWGAEVRKAGSAAEDVVARLSTDDRPRAVVAAGADGRLFRAVLEPVCPVPFVAWPHSGLPGWAGPLDLVVILSTTGSEWEALGVAAEAVRRGARVLVACPMDSPLAESATGRSTTLLPAGSADPLALAVPVLCALHALGLGPEIEVEPVAAALDDVARRCAAAEGIVDNPAKGLTLVLADTVPVVWGGSVLAARAARRVAEALRAASGRPALAGDAEQLVPVLANAPERDIFADPYADPGADPYEGSGDGSGLRNPRPALVVLDDGADGPEIRLAAGRLRAAAESRGVRIHTVTAAEGPDIGRFASLLSTGRFAAAYLALGLGRAG